MAAIRDAFLKYFSSNSSLGDELNRVAEDARKKNEIEQQKIKEKEETEWKQCFNALPADSKEAAVAKKLLENNPYFFQNLPENCLYFAKMGHQSGTVGTVAKIHHFSKECVDLSADLHLLSHHAVFQRKFKGVYLSAASDVETYNGQRFYQCAIKATWKKG